MRTPAGARRFDAPEAGAESVFGVRQGQAAVGPEGYTGTSILAPDLWVPLTSHARGMPDEISTSSGSER